jgi:formylmethanofuran dehydrogenase subunit A
MFGDRASLTGAGPLGYFLHGVTGRKWFNGDIELKEDCGIIKDSAVIVEDGEIREPQEGRSYHAEPPYDAGILPKLRKWFADFYAIEFENCPVDREYLARPERVATAAPAG